MMSLKGGVADLVRRAARLLQPPRNRSTQNARKLWSSSEEARKKKIKSRKKRRRSLRKLWLVSKGTPHNKILKRLKENPDIRAEHRQMGPLLLCANRIKKRGSRLSRELYIIVDEKGNEYELTDKGIQAWVE